jgi:hypothetical protein
MTDAKITELSRGSAHALRTAPPRRPAPALPNRLH